jgi:predicted MFS family arabinose efflux permease
LLVVSISALMVALEEGGKIGWSKTSVIGLFLLTIASGVAFVVQQDRATEPVLPLRLFRNDVIRKTMLLGLIVGTTMMTGGLFFSLFFQDVRFFTPTRSGLATLPMMAGMLIASTLVGRAISRTGKYKIFPLFGLPLSMTGLAISSLLRPDRPYIVIGFGMFLTGIGMGCTMPTLSIASQNSAEPRDLGIATSAQNFARSLGSSIGLAVFGTIFNAEVRKSLAQRLPNQAAAGDLLKVIRQPKQIQALPDAVRSAVGSSISDGASRIFLISVALTGLALFVAFRLREEPLRSTSGMQQQAAMAE